MKILHVIASMNPTVGGPVEGIRQLSRSLRNAGHEIEVACLDKPGEPWLTDLPVNVIPLGPTALTYRYSRRLVSWLRQNRSHYDCVVVNGMWQYSSFGAWLALRGSQTPYVVFTHGMLDPWFKRTYPLKHFKKSLYWPWAEYRILRDASAVCFTCEEERRLAGTSFVPYICNEVVVGYGIESPPGNQAEQTNAFLDSFPSLRSKKLLLYLGRIHPKKGADVLIEAFAKTCDSDMHLVMAGPDQGGWKKTLQAKAHSLGIADRITWTGMLTSDLKWGAFHAAEAFILPSHQENFGIAVAEALACNLPVLISDKVNIWREIEADRAGIVGDDTLDGTVKTLRTWMTMSPEEKQAMRLNTRACFLGRFEVQTAATNLINAISKAQVKTKKGDRTERTSASD